MAGGVDAGHAPRVDRAPSGVRALPPPSAASARAAWSLPSPPRQPVASSRAPSDATGPARRGAVRALTVGGAVLTVLLVAAVAVSGGEDVAVASAAGPLHSTVVPLASVAVRVPLLVALPLVVLASLSAVARWRPRHAVVVAVVLGLLAPAVVATQARHRAGALLTMVAGIAADAAPPPELHETTRLVTADGQDIGRLTSPRVLPLRGGVTSLPPHVVDAFLAAEDQDFAEHRGVDLRGIVRAALSTSTGQGLQGGSTITQQLAKISAVGNERTVLRKLRELAVTGSYEAQMDKDEILRHYLDRVYLGGGQIGLGAAADHWFGVAPHELTLAQAATLAGMVRAPSRLDPRRNPVAAKDRRDAVIALMHRNGSLDEAGAAAATAEPLEVVPPVGLRSPAIVAAVRAELAALAADGTLSRAVRDRLALGGITVRTTIEADTQRRVLDAVGGWPADGITAGAVVLDSGTGAIRAMLRDATGTRSFDAVRNGARDARRLLWPISSIEPGGGALLARLGIDDAAATNGLSVASAGGVAARRGRGSPRTCRGRALAHGRGRAAHRRHGAV